MIYKCLSGCIGKTWLFVTLLLVPLLNTAQIINYWDLDSIRAVGQPSILVMDTRLKNDTPGSATFYVHKAFSLSYTNFDSTIFYLEKANKIFRRKKSAKDILHINAYIANYLLFVEKYQQALDLLDSSFIEARKLRDIKSQHACLLTMAKGHYLMDNMKAALEFGNRADSILPMEHDYHRLLIQYMNLCTLQGYAFDFPHNSKNAISYHHKCIELAKKIQQTPTSYRMECLVARAVVLRCASEYTLPNPNIDTIEKLYNWVLEKTLYNNCQDVFEWAFQNKALFYASINKEFNETEYLEDLLQKNGSSILYRSWGYGILGKVYASKQDFKKAYEAMLNAKTNLDARYQQELAEISTEQDSRFRALEKELENQKLAGILQKEKAAKSQLQLIFLLIIGIIGFSALIFWINQKNRQTIREQQITTRQLMEGEQQERIRIGRDLHDSVGQMLYAIRMQANPGTLDLVDKTITEVRTISHNLVPAALRQLGLLGALEDLADQYNSQSSTHVDLHLPAETESIPLNEQQSLLIFRIIQEIAQNVIKHSSSQKIGINLYVNDNTLHIVLADDGPGASREAIENSRGLGWKNIFERVKLLNGSIEFNPKALGSEIKLSFPIS